MNIFSELRTYNGNEPIKRDNEPMEKAKSKWAKVLKQISEKSNKKEKED